MPLQIGYELLGANAFKLIYFRNTHRPYIKVQSSRYLHIAVDNHDWLQQKVFSSTPQSIVRHQIAHIDTKYPAPHISATIVTTKHLPFYWSNFLHFF